MSWSQEKIEETIKMVKEKIALDSTLKRNLEINPNQTIEEITGHKIPEGIIFNIADLTLTKEGLLTDELDDNQLEEIAGGGCYVNEQITD